MGDSLVAGYSYSAAIPARFVCKSSVNTRTVYTDTLDGSGLTLMDSMLGMEGVSKYYLMLGINEVSYEPPEMYKEDYRRIIKDIRAKNEDSVIYIMSVLPVAYSVEQNRDISKAKIDAFNDVLRALAEEEECYFLDINSAVAEPDGYLSDCLLYTSDAADD